MSAVVWLAVRVNGTYEGEDVLDVCATREAAQAAAERAAAPPRAFLAPPVRPTRLGWRDTPYDDDDRDEAREHTRWADGPSYRYRVERWEVRP